MKKILSVLLVSLIMTLSIFSFFTKEAKAYGDCTQYGTFAYSDGLGYCKCISGYIMGNSLGSPYCVSVSSYCYTNYGYGSEYDYLQKGCKCSSGYVWDTGYAGETCVSCSTKYGYGATSKIGGGCNCRSGYIFSKDMFGDLKCIDADNICHDKIGYNSQYNSSSDKCECRSGYELTLKSISGLECKSCSSKYGIYSSYSYLLKKCECDSGYTLNDESQCVKKQNNVYFILKEVDTTDKKAIIKSDYDYKYYLVTYGSGCYGLSINRYKNNKIVVNLGTDFYVDTYDKIILQNDNETCDIRSVKKVDSSFSLEEEETPIPYYSASSIPNYNCPINSTLFGTDCYCNNGYIAKENICMLNNDSSQSSANIVNGDIVMNPSATGDAKYDVYIVKFVENKKFKRLVLNPQVFASYGHLKWENIKKISTEEMVSYKTSALVKVENDSKILALAPNGDAGSKSWLNVSGDIFIAAGGDWDSVYNINAIDGANYNATTDFTTQSHVTKFLTTGVLP